MQKSKLTLPIVRVRSTGLTDNYTSKEDSYINYEVIRLILYGFATTAVAHRTGLTFSQVQNRVRMYNLQGMRSMFRMGHTEHSQQVMKLAMRVPAQRVNQEKDLYQTIRNGVLETFRQRKQHHQ